MVRLTSLTFVANLALAGWGLFGGRCGGCWAGLSTKLTAHIFSTQTHLGYIGGKASGKRLTNPLKIRQIASSPLRDMSLSPESWNPFLIRHQGLLCFKFKTKVIK